MRFLTDILLVVPLQEEFNYIKNVFTGFEKDTDTGKVFPQLSNLYRLKHHNSGLDVCAVILNDMSNEVAALASERCITSLKPRLVIGIGIAGSLDNEILLADVVISGTVCNYLSESKAVDKKTFKDKTQLQIKTASVSHTYSPQDKFIQFFNNLDNSEWQKKCKSSRKSLRLKTHVKLKKKKIKIANKLQKVKVGNIASGPIVGSSGIFRDFLITIDRKFHALEMEGAGIALACKRQHRNEIDFLLFRGISDFADKNKKALEKTSKNEWRKLAAFNAARLVDECLSTEAFKKLLRAPHNATTPLNIALFLSDHVHYVDSIAAGFRDELARTYAETHFWPHIIQAVGSPNSINIKKNKEELQKLVSESKPEYIVTIGTAATQAAFELYKGKRKVIFLGVSEPEKAGFIGSNFMSAGVSYGVDIQETVELLKQAFPNLTPTFVHNGAKKYAQDDLLLKSLRKKYDTDKVPDLKLETSGSFQDQPNRLYFGRFFLCKNISEFTESNPDKPFVGVSIENIMKGAILSIGYDTLEIGRVGASEILAAHHLAQKDLDNIRAIAPKQRVYGFNCTVSNRIGHQITDEFRKKLTHTFD